MIIYVLQKHPENFAFQLFIILQQFTREICYFLKKQPTFQQFLLQFQILFIDNILRLNNLKTRTDLNAEISVFVFRVKRLHICYYVICMTVPLMFYQIFLSSQMKRCAIITYKHGIYELPHELPNDLRLKISGNQEISGKCLNFIE